MTKMRSIELQSMESIKMKQLMEAAKCVRDARLGPNKEVVVQFLSRIVRSAPLYHTTIELNADLGVLLDDSCTENKESEIVHSVFELCRDFIARLVCGFKGTNPQDLEVLRNVFMVPDASDMTSEVHNGILYFLLHLLLPKRMNNRDRYLMFRVRR